MESQSCVASHTEQKHLATSIQLPVSLDASAFFSAMVLFFKNRPSKIWRRERDSNPRWVAPHLISSQAQSATLSSLRADSFIRYDYRTFGKLKQQLRLFRCGETPCLEAITRSLVKRFHSNTLFLNPVRNARDCNKGIGFQRSPADQSAINVRLRQELFRVIDL